MTAKKHIPGMLKFMTERELNIVRGKTMAGAMTKDDVLNVFGHLDKLTECLDKVDYDDGLSPGGWRNFFGLPE